jgi:hypothetical protein
MQQVTEFELPDRFMSQLKAIDNTYKRQDDEARQKLIDGGFYQVNAELAGFTLHDMVMYVDSQIKKHGVALGNYNVAITTCWPGQAYGKHHDEMFVVHVPVNTNDKSFLVFGDNLYHFEVGKFYIANTRLEHSAFNLGNTPRTHLLLCAYEG